MHAQFRTYRLNEAGQQKAQAISEAFDELLTRLERLVPEGNQLQLCRNQLEHACFFAKKGMAMATGNQEGGQATEEGRTAPDSTQPQPPEEGGGEGEPEQSPRHTPQPVLPTDPAERTAALDELQRDGLITPEERSQLEK